jgi:hypothetical protein
MVNDRVVVPFSAIELAPNDLLMPGGETTVRDDAAVLPHPVVEERMGALLLFTPAVVPVTFTDTVHDVVGASVTPVDMNMLLLPATALTVEPLQEFVSPFAAATTRPAGSVSQNCTPLRVVEELLLVSVKVSEVDPFSGIDAAPKLALMAGRTNPETRVATVDCDASVPALMIGAVDVTDIVVPVTEVASNCRFLMRIAAPAVPPDPALLGKNGPEPVVPAWVTVRTRTVCC